MANLRTQWMTLKDHLRRKVFRIGDPGLDIRQSWASTPARLANSDQKNFLDWFDATDSVEATLKRAEADWSYRFASWPYFQSVKKGRALEIGFGAGRLLLQSSRVFDEVLGVDIHQAFDQTERFLNENGAKHFKLIRREALDQAASAAAPAPIAAQSLDFVYSFIVIQHFDRADELWFYLDRVAEWLKPGGYAHLYFGKNTEPGVREVSDREFTLRDASLFVHPDVMRERAEKLGFRVIEVRDQLAKDPFTGKGQSMQACIVIQRPERT